MRNIDDQLRFHLSKSGWYIGETKINLVSDRLPRLGIDPRRVNFTNSGELAWTDGNVINIHECLGWGASLPQREFLILHEHYHIRREDCVKGRSASVRANHGMEFDCDRLALKHMIDSGCYNRIELYDAISVFGNVIEEEESDTHPSSRDRYNRLLNQLKECGS